MMKKYKVHMVQPYEFRTQAHKELLEEFPNDRASAEAKLRKIRREITESFIENASALMYPQGMTQAEAEDFAQVRLAMDSESGIMELDEKGLEVLTELFLSKEAKEKVRVKPQAAHWHVQWVHYLKKIRHASAA